ncbi:MAG: hypothetical protein KF718_10870 [Polyangiaceae bacterium]|nr:hypothetical protein [Polyangiaceae bacterium]
MKHRLTLGVLALGLGSAGCGVDEIPTGLKRTPDGAGPKVRFDLYHKPLPEVPLPSDSAMWPDPSSRTGLRVNASVVAPTSIEATARKKFDTLEGWGTYAPITVAFDKQGKDDGRPAIDLANVISRHQKDDYELADDAIYLVNLETGVPVFLDLGEGAFQYVVREKYRYWRNDTRQLEQNLMWDTADETIDPLTGLRDPSRLSASGVPIYKPEWDTDFDGVLDRPNLADVDGCPTQVDVALDKVTETARDQCMGDKLLTWYERETDTIIARPLLPLEEKTQYAVVITNRLTDPDGRPVRSPFDFVYHPAQEEGIKKLKAHLSNPELASYYGDIGGKGLEQVAFTWTFTTQPVVEDLRLIRDGLYGKGPLARLAKQFPAKADLTRAVGLVDLEAIADGAEEPAGWESDSRCKDKLKNFYIVRFDEVKTTLRELANQGFGFEGPTLESLIASFDAISHIVVGSVRSPFFIEGGPQGKDPNASFALDFQTGEGKIYEDKVQFLITIPKAGGDRQQPYPVAYYGHGYTSSSLESLGFAGTLAAQGIASVGMNATFHGLELGESELQLAKNLFQGVCHAPFASGLLTGRARDLDGNLTRDSGGDYWTSYLFHTRDVVRQSAVDLLQLFRVFKSFDGKTMSDQDYDGDGAPDLAGDFDGDGVPDIGGPGVGMHAWGQSLGGILAPFVAALDPQVVSAAPTAGSGGLLDVGSRTFQGGAFEGIYLRNFGPLLVGIPAQEFHDQGKANETKCSKDQISLRFVVVDVNKAREVEFQCTDRQPFAQGGTAFVTNLRNGEKRCARMDDEGRFRIGIPSSLGDKLEVQLWDEPDVVDSYSGETGCNPTVSDEHRAVLITKWGAGLVPEGAPDPNGVIEGPVCTATDGCSRFQDKYYAAGSPLVAIAEGFGHIRQTPSLRRFMNLASNIIDPGDPINYAPYFALKPLTDPFGNLHPPTGMLNVVTVGDMNVPLSSGIALGRVAGALPFLTPDAAERYPAYADYVTPAAIYSSLGGKTPNRVLVDNHVMEGINRLRRHPPASCGRNELPVTLEDVVCHPNCSESDTSACLSGQTCVSGRCVAAPVSDNDCAQYLYDADVLDEGQSLYGEAEAAVPLRMGRIAVPATPDTINAVWAPRLKGVPFGPDSSGWSANARIVAQLQAYIEPKGVHGFEPSAPCENWDSGQYMTNLIGRFFASSGTDLYYLSHPTSHHCLAKPIGKGVCGFVKIP